MGALQLSGENICFVTKYMIVTIRIDLFIEKYFPRVWRVEDSGDTDAG